MKNDKVISPKVANIRLKKGKEPITVSGKAYSSNIKAAMCFPTLERQKKGWFCIDPSRIIKNYGDRYELITPGGDSINGGN